MNCLDYLLVFLASLLLLPQVCHIRTLFSNISKVKAYLILFKRQNNRNTTNKRLETVRD